MVSFLSSAVLVFVKLFVFVGASRVRVLFEKAKMPLIVFIGDTLTLMLSIGTMVPGWLVETMRMCDGISSSYTLLHTGYLNYGVNRMSEFVTETSKWGFKYSSTSVWRGSVVMAELAGRGCRADATAGTTTASKKTSSPRPSR